MKRVTLKTALGTKLRPDRNTGIIYGVPVITAGVTKTSGNGIPPFDVDGTTLKQIAGIINDRPAGFASRVTHPELDNNDPLGFLVGKFRNARVEDAKVLADFHALGFAPGSPGFFEVDRLMTIAESSPDDGGVSLFADDIELDPGKQYETGRVMRVKTLKAIDWTGSPAANPSGLLSAAAESVNETNSPGPRSPDQKEDHEMSAENTDPKNPPATPETPAETPKPEAALSAKPSAPAPAPAAKPEPAPVEIEPTSPATKAYLSDLNEIAELAGLDGTWSMKQALSSVSLAEARKIALAEKKNRTRAPIPMGTVSVGSDLNRDSINQAVSDAILLRAGNSTFIEFDEEKKPIFLTTDQRNKQVKTRNAHERAREFQAHTVIEMGRRYLVALGYREADRLGKTALAALLMSRTRLQAALGSAYLAHATGDFSSILADSMGKTLRQAYALQEPTWSLWARKVTAPDFKTIRRAQLSEFPSLVSMPEGDNYEYGVMTDSGETYQLGKFGKGVMFTREAMINDDLDAFSRIPAMMGRAARRLEETTAYAILTANAAMSDTVALFATAHANLSTGVLTVDSISAATALLRKQTPLGGDSSSPLELTPRFLVVPSSKEFLAKQLVSSTVDPAHTNNTPNIDIVRGLTVIPSARLEASSSIIWYLLADFNDIDTVEMAFLAGEEGPTVEEEDEFDNDTRKMKVRHHVAAKAIDHRGMVRSSGA